jgi:hypothetical protein
MAEAKELATKKLESSGLTLADAKQLHITYVESATTVDKSYPPLPALVFNYMDPRTGKPFTFKPHWPEYSRVRILKEPGGFDAQSKKKPLRYLQPPDSGIAAYFPTNVAWDDILDDPNEPLIITEGELKAAKACKEGFATIGLGGVQSYKSAKSGFMLLPELEQINWIKRRVFICYDSDTRTNENVCNALNELAEVLASRGAIPYVLPMPSVIDDGKTGLDDYLVVRNTESFQTLMDDTAQILTLAQPLFNISNKYVYVKNPGIVLVRDTGQKVAPSAFKDHALTTEFAEQYLSPSGAISIRSVSAAAAWLKWPLRVEADQLTYMPGHEQLVEQHGRKQWNTWPGWGCSPEEGVVQPFLDLIEHLFKNDNAARDWFIKWLAYPLQYPGTKLFTSALLWGVKHGTGKSLIGYTMGAIYGKNFTELNQKDLYDGFNEWAENKQFVMGDDVTGSDKRHDSDRLKKFITQKELRLNIKHVQSFTVPDCINYYFTANGPTALFLEDDDRRAFIHEIVSPPLDEAFYVDYGLWLETTGPAALFNYLMHEVDCSDFNPAAPAYRTAAKERMIADVRSDLGAWVSALLTSPEEILKVGQIDLHHDLYTNRELLNLYDPDGKTGTTANGLGRELRRVGIIYALGGKPITAKGKTDRYYIVRNLEKWGFALPAAIQAHLNDAPVKTKKY